VNSDRGFYIFDYLPRPASDIILHGETKGSFSSPAVAVDETVHMMTSIGFLTGVFLYLISTAAALLSRTIVDLSLL
jgi:hypothetical protein